MSGTAGIRALRKIQFAKETVPGTAVAAAYAYRGIGTMEDVRVQKFPVEDIGYISGTTQSYVPLLGANMSWDSSEATYDQLHAIFSGGISALTSGSADGGGSDKLWNYTFPTTGSATPTTYTIEGGDNAGAERMEYSFVKDFTLDGKAGEAMTIAVNWEGRQVTPVTFTAASAITLPGVDYVLFSNGKLYLDAIDGTAGSTLLSNTFIGMKLSVKTGFKSVPTADGNLYFSFIKQVRELLELTVDITFEHDTTSIAEKAYWRSQTARLMRLEWTGPAVTTPGSVYSTKLLRFNMAGKWEKFNKIDEDNGNDIIHGIFRARYDPTATIFANALVVNETSSI